MTRKESYGLVFAGGGGKGAYEIGVWKALSEWKDIHVGAVSGTSVGALNAALYACQAYDKAVDIWENINPQKILTSIKWTQKDYAELAALLSFAPGAIPLRAVERYLEKRSGIFSREELRKIIEDSRIPQELRKGAMPCYATCYNLEELRTQYFQLNQVSSSDIPEVLLASSAIPIVFPVELVGGVGYVDGGLPGIGDNVPVKPLYDAGWRKFIVVYLSREVIPEEEKYEDCQYIEIVPSSHQGGFFTGTLDFSPEGSKRRIQQGYKDMREQMWLIYGSDKKFNKMDGIIRDARSDAKWFHSAVKGQLPDIDSGAEEEKGHLFTDSEDDLTRICHALGRNRWAFNKTLIQLTTNMAASGSLADELHKSDFLNKLWNTISQKDKKLRSAIDRSQICSQKLLIKAMIQMMENDRSSVALVKSVQSQLQAAVYQVSRSVGSQSRRIADLQGMVRNIEDGFSALEQKYKGMDSEFREFAGAVERHMLSAARREKNFEEKLEELEVQLAVQQWAKTIKFREFAGTQYRKLSLSGKIICVISDFFDITGGNWDDSSLLFIKSVLYDLEIDPDELIFIGDVMSFLVYDRKYQEYLFQRNGIFCRMNLEDHGQLLLYEIFQEGVYICGRMEECGLKTDNGLEGYLQLRGLDGQLCLTAFDLTCELLVGMTQLKYENSADMHAG